MPQPDAPSIVVLTGAGISKESGLDTFRDTDGIWSRVRLEDVATPEAFRRDPAKVHGFYNARRRGLLGAEVAPNQAHEALVRLELDWPGEVLLVTQNIDDLHERAGSRNLIHMHGEILKARCLWCDGISPWHGDMDLKSSCPGCGQTGQLRVNVVWFGEVPFAMELIYQALAKCGLFVSIGTSGNVYPAAGFVQEARDIAGAHTVELNLEPSEGPQLVRRANLWPGDRRRAGLCRAGVAPGMVGDRALSELLGRVRACRVCEAELPLGPRPVVRAAPTARLRIVGQAPGTKVHQTGIPWNDPSGQRLRDWLALAPEDFYDESRIAIVPMGFCYPGRDPRGGDKPPRPECAPLWHGPLDRHLPQIELTLLVGLYAQRFYLGKDRKGSLTETVRAWRDYGPSYLPLPHPSWRNTGWLKRNPWFARELLPALRVRVGALVGRSRCVS